MRKATSKERAGFADRSHHLYGVFKISDEKRRLEILNSLQALAEGKLQPVDPFARYAHLLLPIDKQLERYFLFNENYWKSTQVEQGLKAFDSCSSDHVQRVEDLELLYLLPGATDKEAFEAFIVVWKGENPGFLRGSSLGNGYDIRRLAKNTFKYEPFTVYRRRINLAADWDSENGNSVDDSRNRVKVTKENLAHGEPFAAYALHPELLQQTDGTNLPYFDAPGYEVKPSGVSEWRFAPYGCWNADYSWAFVNSYWSDYRYQIYATPRVWES